MSLITRKITAFAKKIADLADKPNLGNSTLLKQYWDSSPEELRVAHNGLIDDLTSTTPGSSGSESLGSAPITGVAGATSYAQLADLKALLDAAVMGTIPDATLDYIKFNAATKAQVTATSVLRQAMINGGLSVNQRVVSGTVVLSAGAYGHDRWKAGASGCTYTFATSNNVTTITITAGSLVQVIEGINLFSGTYTLSWTGTAQGKIGAGSYGASGVTGTVVGGTNLNIEFNTGTLRQVQFNAGSVALPFQPRSFAEELALCKRYYRIYTAVGGTATSLYGSGFCYSTTQADIVLTYEEMRIIPTVIFSVTNQFAVYNAAATIVPLTNIVVGAKSSRSIELLVTVASGLVAGNGTQLLSNSNNLSSIQLDAEL